MMIYANIFQLGVLFWIPTWREQICSVDLRVCATSWMNVSDLQAKFCFCGIIVLVISFTDFVATLETCSWNMFYTVYLGGLPIISCHDYPKTLSGCSRATASPVIAPPKTPWGGWIFWQPWIPRAFWCVETWSESLRPGESPNLGCNLGES